MDKREIRTYKMEIRANEDSTKITGYAAVFDSYSEEMWGFREVIKPGAFKDAIPISDVRALWNHNADYVLGRSTAGTLTLKEDDKGLYVEIDTPDTQWAKDLLVSMKRGDVNQMSFAFIVSDCNWDEVKDGMPIRTITKIQELFDVSPVTYPAYPDTSVGVRSAQEIFAEYHPEPPKQEYRSNESDLDKLKLMEVM